MWDIDKQNMDRIEIPKYLRDSKLLNQLSIQALLKFWGIICISAVLILSIVAVVTNDLVLTRQTKLNDVTKAQSTLRGLEYVLTNFELRRDRLLSSSNLSEFTHIESIEILKHSFEGQLSRLKANIRFIENSDNKIDEIGNNFSQFINHEKSLTDSIRLILVSGDLNNNNVLPAVITEKLRIIKENHSAILSAINNVADLTHQEIRRLSADTYNSSQINLAIAVVISLIVVSVISAGISLVIFRINHPLVSVKEAMHNLSEGELGTRLSDETMTRDEFTELSSDFNRFAKRTQQLVDDIIEAKDALEISEKRTRAILENALVGIAHIKERHLVSVNQKFKEIFCFENEWTDGININQLFPEDYEYGSMLSAAEKMMANGDTYHSEFRMLQNNGESFWCDVSAKPLDSESISEGSIWLFEDINLRKKSEDELRRLTNYDALTELPNRSLFNDRLKQAIDNAIRKKKSIALIYLDLDRFKMVNDSFGFDAGDELLKAFSMRLCEAVRVSDTVCRLGGDEFVVILSELNNNSDAGKVSEKIISSLVPPFKLQDNEVQISPSIGISLFPDDSSNLELLLQNAEAAMFYAKSQGRNNYQYYIREMNAEVRHRLDIEGRLRRALENDDYVLYYQPQVDVKKMKITGYETLVRWHDGDNGIISPNDFIPLLEDIGLIVPVGEWILRQSCKDIIEIKKRNKDFKSISVNFSGRQFIDKNITRLIENILNETKIKPDNVVIEITETILMSETEKSLKILNELSEMGLKLSLDDFGTGYSSLSYLKQFPIDVLKIDQSFVRDLHTNENDAAICDAIIAMGQQLGLKIVAEGVETQEQFEFMQKRRCDAIQGYLFGKPEALEKLTTTLH